VVLQEIVLEDFRNYSVLALRPSPGTAVFFGENAQGKTNLLEAIHLLARASSHRAGADGEMVRWGRPCFLARGVFAGASRTVEIEVTYSEQKGKTVLVNGISRRQSEGLAPQVRVVLFVPDDLQMVKGPASLRRRFLDQETSQVDPTYGFDLSRYTKVLGQRNSLLRAGSPPRDPGLEVWTDQLVEHGARLYQKRLDSLKKICPVARSVHGLFAPGEDLNVLYRPSVPLKGEEGLSQIEDAFRKRLAERAHLEREKAITLVGPHRDDIVFTLNGMDARQYGSQGQQRSIVISVKVSEIEFLRQETGDLPVLLLDDILSELDASRRRHLLEAVSRDVQVFLTCTDYAQFMRDLPTRTEYYRVKAGTVEQVSGG
jgi:DNA replication and repair protein RecF